MLLTPDFDRPQQGGVNAMLNELMMDIKIATQMIVIFHIQEFSITDHLPVAGFHQPGIQLRVEACVLPAIRQFLRRDSNTGVAIGFANHVNELGDRI